MIFAALLLLCPLAQNVDLAKTAAESPASASTTKDSSFSAPEPKVSTDAEIARNFAADNVTNTATNIAAEPAAGRPEPGGYAIGPVKPAFVRYYETPRQKKIWYGLAAAGHGAAAFDAWSTRRAVSSVYGVEANPLLRPFSHSAAIYVATQVSPLVMDYVGKRMMTSRHHWVRRVWWLPQTAGAGMSIAAGVHNVGVVQ